MKKADRILINAHVLCMDTEFKQYERGAVVISGDSIVAIGPEAEITQQYTAPEVLDCDGKIVIPGIVNAHTHVPMTLLRGLADDLRLDVWLMGYMMPVEREFVSPEFVRLGTMLACAEMIRSGTTTFADMYYFEEDIARATVDAGMRALCTQTVLKFPSPDAHSFEESLAISRDFIDRWKGHHLITPSIAPHAPYTCTAEILQTASSIAQEFDVPLHIHLSETSYEVENMRSATGMPVIPYVKKQNIFNAKVLAAHCVNVDEGEIRTMQHADAGVAHCPSSNMKLSSGMAPVCRMLELGLNVGIGTDGTASNNDLDMFEEMRLATFLAKTSTGDPTALPARTTLLMATRLGAQALRLGDIIGSIEAGKRADITIVDVNRIHNSPRFRRDENSPYAQLVYASKATDVTDVMINGKWVMRDRALLTLDEADLIMQSQQIAQKIDHFLIHREESVLSKLVAIGGASQEESFEIQVKVPITDPEPLLQAILSPDIEIIYQRHYREYDTYFSFEDLEQGYLRYREDHFIDPDGTVSKVRSRLTHIGPTHELQSPHNVLLSRSRYLAPADQSLRFYREYFKPIRETEVEKDRLRFFIKYRDTKLFINIDTVKKPQLGHFLEIKSRTWSRQDADTKSDMVNELMRYLGAEPDNSSSEDYFKMIK